MNEINMKTMADIVDRAEQIKDEQQRKSFIDGAVWMYRYMREKSF